MSNYGPSVTVAKLYERQSASGNTYFAGRWGLCGVVLFKTQEVSDSNQAVWVLKVSEPPKQGGNQRPQQPQRPAESGNPAPAYGDSEAAQRPFDDALPF